MCDQLKLSDFVSEEEKIYHQMRPALRAALKKNGVSEDNLIFEQNKEFASVSVRPGGLLCRIKIGKKVKFISFKYPHLSQIDILAPFETQQTKTDRDANFIRVMVPDSGVFPMEELERLMGVVAQNVMDSVTKEFDCCSRYMECSDAKHCVHPDPDFAISCGYRRMLNRGIIFYGTNRTEP